MPTTRFNDGKTDRQGRFWSGTHVRGAGQAGRVHRRALAARPRPLGPQGDRGRRLLQRPRLEPGQPDDVFLRQPHRLVAPTISTPPPATSRTARIFIDLDRHRRHRRRRHGRCRGLLLGDRAGHRQGRPLRPDGQADADDHCCRPTCRPAASSAARTSTSSTSPPPCSAARTSISATSDTPAASSPYDVGVKGLTLPPFRG